MEGTPLTVEETVELAPATTPTPRRRAPRPRAAAKPDAESLGDATAPESVAALESTPDRPPALEDAPDSRSEAVATGEPDAIVSAEPTAAPEVPIMDAIGADAPAITAPVWESPPVERSTEPTGDGRAELNHRNRARDSRGRRDRGPRPASGERSNGVERIAGDGRDGRQAGYSQS